MKFTPGVNTEKKIDVNGEKGTQICIVSNQPFGIPNSYPKLKKS